MTGTKKWFTEGVFFSMYLNYLHLHLHLFMHSTLLMKVLRLALSTVVAGWDQIFGGTLLMVFFMIVIISFSSYRWARGRLWLFGTPSVNRVFQRLYTCNPALAGLFFWERMVDYLTNLLKHFPLDSLVCVLCCGLKRAALIYSISTSFHSLRVTHCHLTYWILLVKPIIYHYKSLHKIFVS